MEAIRKLNPNNPLIRQTSLSKPWESEPDRVEFKYMGFDCLIRRAGPKGDNPKDWLGNLCGYVAVPKGHPYYGKQYDDETIDLHAHGGLTYSEHCQGEICHKTDGTDEVWWFGFDCAHCGDLIPSVWEMRQPGGILHTLNKDFDLNNFESYKTIAFVKKEIRKMVKQLKAVA